MSKQPAGKKPSGNTRSSAGGIIPRKEVSRESRGLSVEPPMDDEWDHPMGAQAADLCARQRGFERGAEFQNWLEGEAEIDRILMH